MAGKGREKRFYILLKPGIKLMKLREESGDTRKAFAEKIGVHVQTLFQIEKCSKDMTLSTFYSYAYGLGLSASQLMNKLEKEV